MERKGEAFSFKVLPDIVIWTFLETQDVCLLGTNKDEAEVNDISPKRTIAIYLHPFGTRAGSVNILSYSCILSMTNKNNCLVFIDILFAAEYFLMRQ